ncbi:DUF3152 domain-containing protein [Micromonospora aurantiaca]|uniref:DUF3152 domain-containing protein n=1 Tax=Micromonospora aurantiaca (nom. illeg.) TaxID=47850 RepID=A0ABQ6UAL3_9ACTN|nr:DUF3152 domain-containing protein [Micromonospora aurantiaca]KAB1107786.1 DUF3152 domain-containing protein [Micromonospora aurantiaca]UFN96409.1 DUF3152 domain-containing protein [Micromonospora aurantiaca]
MTRTVDRTRGGAAVIALAVSLAGCTPAVADQPAVAPSGPSAAVPSASAAAPVRSRPARIGYPADGGDEWRFAAAEPATGGGTGRLLRYRVAVERDITGLPPADFAAQVTGILTGPGGWTTDGRIALRRVGARGPADFTVYLATPGTRDDLCGDGPDRYTSCRSGDRVVVNVARWVRGAPAYGSDLAAYRRYVVNHEVGHRLGHGHERCPGRGRPAPVMQQQTLGLHGCTPNPLPFLRGERYAGRSGAYDDRLPPPEGGRAG